MSDSLSASSGTTSRKSETTSSAHAGRVACRGQSELLGFFLIFSVGIVVVALVTVTGFAGLESSQNFQRTSNAEQAFTALSTNVDDLRYHGAPSRTTEVRITDAQLSLAKQESITIRNESGDKLARIETRPIVYDSGTGTTLTYYNGALVRQDGDSAVMFREPDFVVTDGAVILPIVRTVPAADRTLGGRAAVSLVTRHERTARLSSNTSVTEFTVNLTTQHTDAWTRYFEQLQDEDGIADVTVDTDDGYVAATIELPESSQLSVTADHVVVSFQ